MWNLLFIHNASVLQGASWLQHWNCCWVPGALLYNPCCSVCMGGLLVREPSSSSPVHMSSVSLGGVTLCHTVSASGLTPEEFPFFTVRFETWFELTLSSFPNLTFSLVGVLLVVITRCHKCLSSLSWLVSCSFVTFWTSKRKQKLPSSYYVIKMKNCLLVLIPLWFKNIDMWYIQMCPRRICNVEFTM